MEHKKKQKRVLLACIVLIFAMQHCMSAPLNNVFDTQPLYTVFGTDKFYKEQDKGEIRFHVSPFYQSCRTARNNDGTKVPLGDRLGQWNMFGIFFGQGAAPIPLNFAANPAGATYLNYQAAGKSIYDITIDQQGDPAANPSQYNRYRGGLVDMAILPLTDEANFKPELHSFVFVSQPSKYEKIGVRSQMNFEFGFGLGIGIKGGVVDVKNSPSNFVLESQFAADTGQLAGGDAPTPSTVTNAQGDARKIYNALFERAMLRNVLNDLGINIDSYHKTAAEDMFAHIYWHFPIDCEDKTGDVALTFIPYLSAGAWIPTGKEQDQNKIFSVPTGNNGFYAFAAEASLAFDFPIIPKTGQVLQVAIGGGITMSGSRILKQQRFLTSDQQCGLIPWKTDISKRPGMTWYLNASMKSEEFVEGLSVYLDYIYTQHLRDKATMLQAANSAPLKAFQAGYERWARESGWRNQQVNVGFNYRLADGVMLGAAAQGHISGTRVARTVTLLGGLTFAL